MFCSVYPRIKNGNPFKSDTLHFSFNHSTKFEYCPKFQLNIPQCQQQHSVTLLPITISIFYFYLSHFTDNKTPLANLQISAINQITKMNTKHSQEAGEKTFESFCQSSKRSNNNTRKKLDGKLLTYAGRRGERMLARILASPQSSWLDDRVPSSKFHKFEVNERDFYSPLPRFELRTGFFLQLFRGGAATNLGLKWATQFLFFTWEKIYIFYIYILDKWTP